MIVDSAILIENGELTSTEIVRLKKQLEFWPDQDTMVQCWAVNTRGLVIPRGAWAWVPDHIKYVDRRSFPSLPELKIAPGFKLDYQSPEKSFEGQAEALQAMFDNEQGMIIRGPGTGKSAIGMVATAKAGTRSLILVHTEDILQQWISYYKQYTVDTDIGIWRGKDKRIGHVTIATVQTLYKNCPTPDWWEQFGMIILDEAAHCAAGTFHFLMNQCPAKYRFGLTASKTRSDGYEQLNYIDIGPIIHERGLSTKYEVYVSKLGTNFRFNFQGGSDFWARKNWAKLIDTLISDPERNSLIGQAVDRELDNGRSVLVLSRRIDHLENIQALLDNHSEVLAAKVVTKKQRQDILSRFRSRELKCVLGTQLADEALDIPAIDTIVLAFPGKHKDLLLQQVGRALREFPGKQDVRIIDVADEKQPILNNHFRDRKMFYRKNDFKIVKDELTTPSLLGRLLG